MDPNKVAAGPQRGARRIISALPAMNILGLNWPAAWPALRHLGVLALCLAALALLASMFWPDEDLDPEVQRRLDFKPRADQKQNAYHAMWGMTASPELDAFAVGERKNQAYEAALRAGGDPQAEDDDKLDGPHPVWRSHPLPALCGHPLEVSCVQTYRLQHKELLAQAQELSVLLQRYRALRGYAFFEVTRSPHQQGSALPWQAILRAGQLVDAQIVWAVDQREQRGAALTELQQEVVLWRRFGLDANTLLDRMAAQTLLAHKLRLAAELLSQYPELAVQYAAQLQTITQPLDDAEASLANAMEGEFRFMAYLSQSASDHALDASEDSYDPQRHSTAVWVHSRQYRPHMVLNMAFSEWQKSRGFYSQSPQAIATQQTEFDRQAAEPPSWAPRLWLFDAWGKVTVAVAPRKALAEDSHRLTDLLAFSRLLELQRQIAAGSVAPAQLRHGWSKPPWPCATPTMEAPCTMTQPATP